MPRWEYQVIHLNVDPGKGGEPSGAPGGPPPFTQSYLEQEFPEHYSHPQPPPPGAAGPGPADPQPPAHPAKQLQDFLNGHGDQGWSLIGIFPLGPLLMMVMRRRRSEADPAPDPANTLADTPADSRLEAVLARLEALERRLEPLPPEAPPAAAGLDDGSVLPPAVLDGLAGESAISGREAAEAIGYRSTASLSNLGSRTGYPLGLVKLGLNGKAAVYRGVGPASSGGKPQRHWVVVPLSRLRG